jgi:hypothetical protein
MGIIKYGSYSQGGKNKIVVAFGFSHIFNGF